MFLFATYVCFELFFAIVKVYHIHGLFGKATDDFTENGLIREKSTYGERLRLRDAVHIQLVHVDFQLLIFASVKFVVQTSVISLC